MPRPRFFDFVLSRIALTLPVFCTVQTRKNILSVEGDKKGTGLILRAGGFMATFKGMLLAHPPLCTHTIFHGSRGRSGPSKDDRQEKQVSGDQFAIFGEASA